MSQMPPPDPSTRLGGPGTPPPGGSGSHRNLNPNQFLGQLRAKTLGQRPTPVEGWNQDEHPFKENPNTFQGPSWAMHAANAVNRYEASKAFSRPGGGIRALKYTLTTHAGQAPGVRQTEIGEALGRGTYGPGMNRGEKVEREDGGGD